MPVESSTKAQCPDPSAHQKNLSEQASTAALYVTHPERGNNPREVLNPDGKLSSKSAAASLKYAKPQDLPSFPTHGINTSNSAGQAAMLAKDYKMKDLWQPELSSAGSKAALLAHKDGGKLDLWQPSASAEGNSAAKLAMRNKTLSPQLDYGYTKDGRSNALLAATKSQRNNRSRAGSTPAPALPVYPDAANSAYNALNAATVSHKASTKTSSPRDPDGWNSPAMQAARIQNIGDHMDRQMFTEHPPVELELQEKRDKDALRASAVSMAKQMYTSQHRTVLGNAPGSSDGKTSAPPPDIKQEAMRYIHLQDAAHKLAQERLAKVDKNFEAMRYREYYGYDGKPQRSKLSMSGLMRKRASSDAGKPDPDTSDDDDQAQARRVRTQMSTLNTAAASVDVKKQQTDRDALMAAAQKRVQKSMADMDAKVFQDTGKVSQSMMDEWELKAKKKATEDSEKREVNRGKTHIGAGKYMETSEIEAIAAARLQPTLDEISANAERRRAHDEEIRLEHQQYETFKQQEKLRQKEGKEEWKRFKEEEKATAKKDKEERKVVEKDEPDNKRSFLSRLSVMRKSKDTPRHEAEGGHVEKVKDDRETIPASSTTVEPVSPVVKEPVQPVSAVKEPVQPSPAVEEPVQPSPAVKEPVQPVSIPSAQDSTLPLAAEESTQKIETPVASSGAVHAHEPITRPETTTTEEDTAKSQKGIKGLFQKLRSRKSHTEEESSELRPAANTSASVGATSVADEEHEKAIVEPKSVVASSATEPLPIWESTDPGNKTVTPLLVGGVGSDAAPISPSSFRRRDADGNDADISSLSSGVDEDDFKGGRTGRAARASRKEEVPAATTDTLAQSQDDTKDENETFVDARDAVSPGVGAPPESAFVVQNDATQHGRETKFQEVL